MHFLQIHWNTLFETLSCQARSLCCEEAQATWIGFNWCKTQNSGLRSKEEKPCNPINQPSRCNTQEGLLTVAQTGWLWSPGRQSTPNSKLGKLFIDKKTILSAYYIWVTKWLVTCLQSNPIGTNFAGFCLNLGAHGLFSSPAGFLLGAYWLADSRSPDGGGESHHFTGNRNPSPGCLPAPAPAAPHNKTYFSASKSNKKNIRHMNYRHR